MYLALIVPPFGSETSGQGYRPGVSDLEAEPARPRLSAHRERRGRRVWSRRRVRRNSSIVIPSGMSGGSTYWLAAAVMSPWCARPRTDGMGESAEPRSGIPAPIPSRPVQTRYQPGEVESRVFERWESAGIFSPEPEGEANENYSIAIPPPNVTGELHMGHALNGAIQDALIRLKRMQGRRARWIFGTDHAGIAVQVKVEQQLADEGTSRHEIGREAFVERAWRWREKYGSTIVGQYKRLGASCDYADERFTMDDAYARAVAHVFVKLHRKNYVYRDEYMVNWDPGIRSAISDHEVEQRSVEDTMYMLDYPLESGSGSITVATVRPETMLADTAIAVNPEDERYTRLIGETAILPLVGRKLKIVADPYVDPEFGTGALKITPGHDPNDFEIGRSHGLDEVTVIGEDGRMTATAGERFAGLTVDEARNAVVAALRAEDRISGTQPYLHDVPHSQRSGERIEPLISLQWFCDMTELAQPAIAAVRDGRVRFHPENPHTAVYLGWMENIRPWVLSRQLWWGHQLPVWYCDKCEETFVAESEPGRCGACDGPLRRDPDVLDTWFSSALWPFATLGWPEQTPQLRAFYPTDVLSTARDIIFLWVARMVMLGVEFTGQLPFADVPVHATIQAPDGRRMSKSLGTGIDPLEVIDVQGADALRFGLLAMSSAQDVKFSHDRVKQGQELANKLWNASRLVVQGVAAGVEPAPRPETVEDRWILSVLERATERITELYESFELSRAALELYDVLWDEVCDWYLELVKPRLYDESADRAAVSATLLHVLERVLKLMHPVMPFVTEEIWSYLPGERPLLAASEWPVMDASRIDPGAEEVVERLKEAVTALRRYREDVGAKAAARPRARLAAEGYEEVREQVARLARFELAEDSGDPVAAVAVPGGAVEVLPSADIDPQEAERRRAERAAVLRDEIARAEVKLANEKFVAKAPAEIVDGEREKLARFRAELDELEGAPSGEPA
jgi:valyl-tRNA synthetase